MRDTPSCPSANEQGKTVLLAAAAIVLAGVLAYSNSFSVPLLFDDLSSVGNPTVQRLWPIWRPLCPPNHGEPVSGRPVVNLSLAINYVISGMDVWSYHAANLAIHLAAALTLFGLIRRTLLLPSMHARFGAAATPLALGIALLWAVHPLQTESVTYIIQRAESLAALFYLLTLYCFVRGRRTDAPVGRFQRPRRTDIPVCQGSRDEMTGKNACPSAELVTGKNSGPPDGRTAIAWDVATVIACLFGMATKETMVSAPLMLLLYDRAFVAGSFAEAWRRRRWLYAALAATWCLLAWLVVSTGNRGGTAGLGAGVGPWQYLCTQFVAIVHYLRLCFWPQPLVFDYGHLTIDDARAIVPCAIVVVLLGGATLVALWRWPKAGFLGAAFLALLAPTSSIVPVATQTIAEHRMYLPLAAVATAVLAAVYLVGRCFQRGTALLRGVAALLVALTVAGLGTLTYHRNADYRTGLAIWQDTAEKASGNWRAHNNFGLALAASGRTEEAAAQYDEALRLWPDAAEAHINLSVILANCGRSDDALAHCRAALRAQPNNAAAHNNYGSLLGRLGRLDEAAAEFRRSLEIDPTNSVARGNLRRCGPQLSPKP
ncbi:MAG: tetratricopeptide repeat protein [Thermoguttaceae bacterium]